MHKVSIYYLGTIFSKYITHVTVVGIQVFLMKIIYNPDHFFMKKMFKKYDKYHIINIIQIHNLIN